jgi:hypothetical protein
MKNTTAHTIYFDGVRVSPIAFETETQNPLEPTGLIYLPASTLQVHAGVGLPPRKTRPLGQMRHQKSHNWVSQNAHHGHTSQPGALITETTSTVRARCPTFAAPHPPSDSTSMPFLCSTVTRASNMMKDRLDPPLAHGTG